MTKLKTIWTTEHPYTGPARIMNGKLIYSEPNEFFSSDHCRQMAFVKLMDYSKPTLL